MRTEQKENKIWGKGYIMMAAFLLLILLCAATVYAAPKVKEAEYEGKGKVEVEFRSQVQYKNLKIAVKDASGKTYGVQIVEKDKDDVEFLIKKYKTGMTYTWKISGIRKKGESSYGTVSGTISIPKVINGIAIKEVEYDSKDKEVSIEFDTFVQWKNPKVTISDGKKNYVVRIDEKSKDEIEVKVKGLKAGNKYIYKISGIRKKGSASYTTISDTFVA